VAAIGTAAPRGAPVDRGPRGRFLAPDEPSQHAVATLMHISRRSVQRAALVLAKGTAAEIAAADTPVSCGRWLATYASGSHRHDGDAHRHVRATSASMLL